LNWSNVCQATFNPEAKKSLNDIKLAVQEYKNHLKKNVVHLKQVAK